MLDLIPTPDKPQPWLAKATRTLSADAYDHPDFDEYRAALVEMAALETRLRELAAGAAYDKPLLAAAAFLEDAAGEIEFACWAWNDDRDSRDIGNRAEAQRVCRGMP